MALWRLLVYYPDAVTCPMKDWYDSQDDVVQAEFDATVAILLARRDWADGHREFKVLARDHAGLGEIRFRLDKPSLRRFRPVGIWPPLVDREFILLLGCEKPQRGVYLPADAFTRGLEYKRMLEAGIGEIRDYF
jgi:hypothetical protein